MITTYAESKVQEGCTCHEVQEGEALKVLGLLVAELHNLVVALSQGLDPQPMPCVLVVQLLQHNLKVVGAQSEGCWGMHEAARLPQMLLQTNSHTHPAADLVVNDAFQQAWSEGTPTLPESAA